MSVRQIRTSSPWAIVKEDADGISHLAGEVYSNSSCAMFEHGDEGACWDQNARALGTARSVLLHLTLSLWFLGWCGVEATHCEYRNRDGMQMLFYYNYQMLKSFIQNHPISTPMNTLTPHALPTSSQPTATSRQSTSLRAQHSHAPSTPSPQPTPP